MQRVVKFFQHLKKPAHTALALPAHLPEEIWEIIDRDIPLSMTTGAASSCRFFRNHILQRIKNFLLRHYAPTEEIRALIQTRLKHPRLVYNILQRINTSQYVNLLRENSVLRESIHHCYENPLFWYCLDDNPEAFARCNKNKSYNYRFSLLGVILGQPGMTRYYLHTHREYISFDCKDHGLSTHGIFDDAIQSGDINIIKQIYLSYEKRPPYFQERFLCSALRTGKIEIVQFVLDLPKKEAACLNGAMIESAAKSGRLEMLSFLVSLLRPERHKAALKEYSNSIIDGAVTSGRIEILDAFRDDLRRTEYAYINLSALISSGMTDHCIAVLAGEYGRYYISNQDNYIISSIQSGREECVRKVYALKDHPLVTGKKLNALFNIPDNALDAAALQGNTIILETVCQLANANAIILLPTQKTLCEAAKSGNLCMVMAVLALAEKNRITLTIDQEVCRHAPFSLRKSLEKLCLSSASSSRPAPGTPKKRA